MIEALENAIVERLKAAFPGLDVKPFPDKAAEFRLTHAAGALLVHYRHGKYSQPQVTAAIVQKRRMEFEISIYVRSLRSHLGAYSVLEGVRAALTGFNPEGVMLFPVDEQFQEFANSVWIYTMGFGGDAPAVATWSPELAEIAGAPQASQITFEGDGEQLVVGG
ncbi:MAG: hypothetical protein HQK81_06145 [Desulfovibrionaceae bacterium]|nr:hypothetical protein [Desulfovibrionaceae bacterium]MBF0513630.1 hypothetical protein [Desulfovibrionaceae bacterium]